MLHEMYEHTQTLEVFSKMCHHSSNRHLPVFYKTSLGGEQE